MSKFATNILLLLWLHLAYLVLGQSTSAVERSRAQYLASDNTIRGVNLGGWLLTERWITPSVYRSTGANDEWHLCVNLGTAGCRRVLERHWGSFITRDDLWEIARAGLNSVRVPVGFWAVDVVDGEPYASGQLILVTRVKTMLGHEHAEGQPITHTQYPYLIQAVRWAQEFGLTVSIDLHGLPGGQNGQDNSGITGVNEFAANTTNLERAVRVVRNFTEEFTRPEYGRTVRSIELANEPRLTESFTMSVLRTYYASASSAIRSSTTPLRIIIHDAFYGPAYWANYSPTLSPASYPPAAPSPPDPDITLDTHQYYAFPPLGNLSQADILSRVCAFSALVKRGIGADGPIQGALPNTVVGEWSLESGSGHEAAASSRPTSQEKRTWLRKMFEAQLAAYTPIGEGQAGVGWYYWTWKTEYDHDTWSYRRGMWDGYIPLDIRNASNLVFPLRTDGCIDAAYEYVAPSRPGSGSGSGGPRVATASASVSASVAAVLVLIAGCWGLVAAL